MDNAKTLLLMASLLPSLALAAPTQSQADTIPYFSEAGQVYAKQHYIPAPPVERYPRSEIDPPRDTPAEKWTSKFCKTWTDNCTKCAKANGTQTCDAVPIQGETTCVRHRVACTETIEAEPLFGLCRSVESHELSQIVDGKEEDLPRTWSGGTWVFDRNEHKWKLHLAEDSALPVSNPKRPRPVLRYLLNDNICARAVGEPPGDGDFFDNDPIIER